MTKTPTPTLDLETKRKISVIRERNERMITRKAEQDVLVVEREANYLVKRIYLKLYKEQFKLQQTAGSDSESIHLTVNLGIFATLWDVKRPSELKAIMQYWRDVRYIQKHELTRTAKTKLQAAGWIFAIFLGVPKMEVILGVPREPITPDETGEA